MRFLGWTSFYTLLSKFPQQLLNLKMVLLILYCLVPTHVDPVLAAMLIPLTLQEAIGPWVGLLFTILMCVAKLAHILPLWECDGCERETKMLPLIEYILFSFFFFRDFPLFLAFASWSPFHVLMILLKCWIPDSSHYRSCNKIFKKTCYLT